MNTSFYIQGSGSEPYEIMVEKIAGSIKLGCTCMAGMLGKYCKHKVAVITSDEKILKSSSDIDKSRSIFSDSALLTLIEDIKDTEAEIERQKKVLKNKKSDFARQIKL